MRHDAVAPARRLVLAHGFTQTARSWATMERLLRTRLPGAETVAVDLPGHGEAPPPPDADLWASAHRLVDAGGAGTYVGYSMGGRVALHAALTRRAEVLRIVLIGATAGIEDPDERRARRTADERLAAHIESVGVSAFLDEWLANPLFAGLSDEAAGRTDRLRNTATGLAASLRATGTGTQTPLWERLGEVHAPALVVVGEDDAKFTSLGRRLVEGLPNAELVVIAGAGHSVHLEQPAATADAIASWLAVASPVTPGVRPRR
jgi:2-succinyl-6-hydroxy-2,4-cyclohexadiene-1-carboxylate synthase